MFCEITFLVLLMIPNFVKCLKNEIEPTSALDTTSGSGNPIDCGSNEIKPNVDIDHNASDEEEQEY